MSQEQTIRNAVVTALQAISGMTSKVVIGRPATLTEGPSPPVIWVAVGDIGDEFGPDLPSYQTRLTLDLVCVAAATDSTPEARENASLDLMTSIRAAVRAVAPSGIALLQAPLCEVAVRLEAMSSSGMPAIVGAAQFLYLSEVS
mgnify:CR=1 FL=1|jgi:hypothetical protein